MKQNSDNNSDNENESDNPTERLMQEIKNLRQETNFDVLTSLTSSKKMILDEFLKCTKLASAFFSIRCFNPKQIPSIILPSYDPKFQTKQFSSYSLYYKKLYSVFFNHPEKFAKIIYDSIIKDQSSVNFIAYILLPTLYNYFIDKETCEKAQELLISIIDLVRQVNEENNSNPQQQKNGKSIQINIEIFFPLFQSFFLSAFSFHDLLWNNFYSMYYENEDVPHFDRFIKCIKISVPKLFLYLPVLRNLLLHFHDEGLKFIVQNLFKPSFDMYQNFFAGTDLVFEVLTILQNAHPSSDDILAIHEALFSCFDQNQNFIEITKISFSDGLPIHMTCETMSKFLKMLKPEDEIDSPKIFEMLQKSINELDKSKEMTIVLSIFHDYKNGPDFSIKKSENHHFLSIWEHIKRKAEETSVDPLSLLPRMNKNIEDTSIAATEEFTTFALEEELKVLKSRKEILSYVIELTMIYQSITSLGKTLESIVYHSYDEFIHDKSIDCLQIQPIMRRNKISYTFLNSLKIATKLGLPLEQCSIPLLITVLDKITILPNLANLKDGFNTIKGDFQIKMKEKHAEDFAILDKELERIKKILLGIIQCPCGQQLVKLNEVANVIQILFSICSENGINLEPMDLFSYAFPMSAGADILLSIVRIYQVRNIFTAENCPIPQTIFQKLDIINSWLMGFLQEESRFVVDILCPEIIKMLS